MSDVHVFDEAQDVAAALEPARHRQDFPFVHAALDDHVDLDRRETRVGSGIDAFQDLCDGEIRVVHRAKNAVVDRVEAHRHSVQPCGFELARLSCEQRAVGRQCQVETVDRGEHFDQPLQIATEQGLAAGEPDLLDAMRVEQPREARDLLEGQQVGMGKERVVAPENVLWHAIDAAEVAAVGDRYAQVAQAAAERIGEQTRRRDARSGRRERNRGAGVGEGNDSGHGAVDKANGKCNR